jgi:hypothetical protein
MHKHWVHEQLNLWWWLDIHLYIMFCYSVLWSCPLSVDFLVENSVVSFLPHSINFMITTSEEFGACLQLIALSVKFSLHQSDRLFSTTQSTSNLLPRASLFFYYYCGLTTYWLWQWLWWTGGLNNKRAGCLRWSLTPCGVWLLIGR